MTSIIAIKEHLKKFARLHFYGGNLINFGAQVITFRAQI